MADHVSARRIPNKQILVDEVAVWGTTAMPTTPRPIGNSPPKMLAPNLSTYTLQSD
jgi:hypothetical protein